MAMRVSATEVKAILDDSTLLDAIVDSYILGANAMVNQTLTTSGLSVEIMKEVERWITAHLISVTRERMAKKEGAGGAFIEYAGEYGEGLKSTTYGQTAIALDSSGILASLAGRKATIFAVPD